MKASAKPGLEGSRTTVSQAAEEDCSCHPPGAGATGENAQEVECLPVPCGTVHQEHVRVREFYLLAIGKVPAAGAKRGEKQWDRLPARGHLERTPESRRQELRSFSVRGDDGAGDH